MRLGDIVLLRMEFTRPQGQKCVPRWCSWTLETMISSPRLSLPAPDFQSDLVIEESSPAGLNVPSFVRVHKLTVLPKDKIVRQLGSLCKIAMRSLRC
jgi:hypothetical protein